MVFGVSKRHTPGGTTPVLKANLKNGVKTTLNCVSYFVPLCPFYLMRYWRIVIGPFWAFHKVGEGSAE